MKFEKKDIIDEDKIQSLLDIKTDIDEIKGILKKGELKKGLSVEDCAKLLTIKDKEAMDLLFASAKKIKDEIYGPRLVLFAPLYLSSFCVNDCTYCAFHASNKAPRKKLTMDEVRQQVKLLEAMGHKRLLLEFGEHPTENPIDYVIDVIKTIYDTKEGRGEIRRVNVNIAATTVENYKKLKEAGIGTYQLFQETFHEETYKKLHRGPKADYMRQLTAIPTAFEGGIDDLGIGALFGLYDYRFEVLAMVQYAEFMDKTLGVGPHTLSVPRFQSAHSVDESFKYNVSDEDFLKLIAILRLAVPYTGMIISTRETPEIRRQAFAIGISQTSAGSKTDPGGYSENQEKETTEQFHINDHRSLDEIVKDICESGYLPSFCTACYREGRTGDVFMELAKAGTIHNLCQPNAIVTFKEYLLDYASEETRLAGEKCIAAQLEAIETPESKQRAIDYLAQVEQGKRDIHV